MTIRFCKGIWFAFQNCRIKWLKGSVGQPLYFWIRWLSSVLASFLHPQQNSQSPLSLCLLHTHTHTCGSSSTYKTLPLLLSEAVAILHQMQRRWKSLDPLARAGWPITYSPFTSQIKQVLSLPAWFSGSTYQVRASLPVVQALSHVRLCAPEDCSTPGFPVHHQLLELTQTHVHHSLPAFAQLVVMPCNHPILCPPLLLLPSIFPSIRVFSYQVTKVLEPELELQHRSFQWIFRADFR